MVAQKLFSQHKKRAGASTSVDVSESRAEHERANETDARKLDIYNLEGGIFQWACEEREIVNRVGEKVNTVHPYSSVWGKLLPAQLRHKF